MIRLHAVVEGQTEETWLRDQLAPHLAGFGVVCDGHRITTSRSQGHVSRGGLLKYSHLRRDLDLWMREDAKPDAWFTTLIDMYALPRDMPSFGDATNEPDPIRRACVLENAMAQDLGGRRFLPYLQVHEFEALLMVDPLALLHGFPGRESNLRQLVNATTQFPTPEHINGGLHTSPSKRIIGAIPEYAGRKPTVGPLVAGIIGLEALRSSCRHFGEWLSRLERLDGRVTL